MQSKIYLFTPALTVLRHPRVAEALVLLRSSFTTKDEAEAQAATQRQEGVIIMRHFEEVNESIYNK